MASKMMMYCSVFLICAVWLPSSSGSAIPMWEYLSRGEKMSHLYSMFAKQVNAYCKTNTAEHSAKPQCKRDLLMYGLGKLQTMTETHLDSMDPYQRGASDIVWDHMMDGHPTSAAKKESTTQAPIMEPTGTFQRNPIFDNDNAQPSPKKPATHEDYAMGMDMDSMYGQYQSPKDQENLYPEPQNHLHQETNINEQYVNPLGLDNGYLSGPMMVMVKPDGTPVNSHLPKDDDQEAMTIGRQKLPTIQQIQQNFGTTRNLLEENQEIGNGGAPVYSAQRPVYRNSRYQTVQKRSYYYHPSYLPQMYRSNQH